MDGDAPEDKEGDMAPLGVGLRDRGGAAESELILVGVMESDRDPVGVPVVLSDGCADGDTDGSAVEVTVRLGVTPEGREAVGV